MLVCQGWPVSGDRGKKIGENKQENIYRKNKH
jgi:hypothetical protein